MLDTTQAGSDGPDHHVFYDYGESLFSWVEDYLETVSYDLYSLIIWWKSPVPMSIGVYGHIFLFLALHKMSVILLFNVIF